MAELPTEELKKLEEVLKNLGGETFGIQQAFEQMAQKTDGARQAFEQMAQKAGISIKGLTNKITDMYDAMQSGSPRAEKSVTTLTTALLGIEPIFNILDKNRKVFGQIGEEAKKSANLLTESFGATKPVIEATLGLIPGMSKTGIVGLTDLIGRMTESADKARALEAGLLQTAAATGKLEDFIGATGEDFSLLGDRTAAYTEMLDRTARATGRTTTQVAEFAGELGKVPGALDLKVVVEGAERMNMLTAAMRLSAGTGIKYKDVVGGLNDAFRLFNLEGEDALEFVNRIAIATQNLQLPMDLVSGLTKETARQFKFFGDNTEGALEVMGRFSRSLRDMNIGPEAVKELVSGTIQSIQKLDVAQRAFLSQQSGGPGGLQGAFEIQSMLRQGRLDEVFGRVEQTLRKQFGGRVVTTEQAAQSQDAAAQMMRQIAFLTQGPTAIAQNEEQATRIIDAMAQGQMSALEGIFQDPQQEMLQSLSRGEDFQESQVSLLTRLAQIADHQLMTQSLIARAAEKQAFGQESVFARALRDNMAQGAAEAANVQPIAGEGQERPTREDAVLNVARDFKEGGDLIGTGIKSALTTLDEVTGGNLSKITDQLKGFKAAFMGGLAREGQPEAEQTNDNRLMQEMQRRAKLGGEALRRQELTAPPNPENMVRADVARQAAIQTQAEKPREPHMLDINLNILKEGEVIGRHTKRMKLDELIRAIEQEQYDVSLVGTNPGG